MKVPSEQMAQAGPDGPIAFADRFLDAVLERRFEDAAALMTEEAVETTPDVRAWLEMLHAKWIDYDFSDWSYVLKPRPTGPDRELVFLAEGTGTAAISQIKESRQLMGLGFVMERADDGWKVAELDGSDVDRLGLDPRDG